MTNEYQVGRGKPPVDGQFKKGESGNPKGRPKKSATEDHEKVFRDLLLRPKAMVLNGEKVEKSMLEVMLLKQFEMACKGDNAASRLIVNLAQKLPKDKQESVAEYHPVIIVDDICNCGPCEKCGHKNGKDWRKNRFREKISY